MFRALACFVDVQVNYRAHGSDADQSQPLKLRRVDPARPTVLNWWWYFTKTNNLNDPLLNTASFIFTMKQHETQINNRNNHFVRLKINSNYW